MSDRDDEPAGPRAPDPRDYLPDPSELTDVPEPEAPEPPRPRTDVPAELRRDFWTTVAAFKVALLATSLGALMLGFGVRRPLGAALLLVGLAAFVRGYQKTRAFLSRHD